MMRRALIAALVVATIACGAQPRRAPSLVDLQVFASTCFACPPPQTPTNFQVWVLPIYSDGTEGNSVSGACGSYEFIGPDFSDTYAGCTDSAGTFGHTLKRIGHPNHVNVTMTYRGLTRSYSDSGP